MKLALGGSASADGVVLEAIREGIANFDQLAIAVSYVQRTGWELVEPLLSPNASKVRLLCTDQFGISDPAAIRLIMKSGVRVRAFASNRVYHPKIYIASRLGEVDRCVLGSANLSRSALQLGVEAATIVEDRDGAALSWFDSMFASSAPFDDARLDALKVRFDARTKGELSLLLSDNAAAVTENQESLDLIERLFSEVGPYVAPLSFNQGKNNIRNLSTMIEALKRGARNQYDEAEMRFAGLMDGHSINALGRSIALAPDIRAAAWLWVPWFRDTPNDEQPYRKFGNLAVAKRAFSQFWRMKPAVRDYFLQNSVLTQPPQPEVLWAIELLANGSRVAEELTLRDVRAIAPLLSDLRAYPPASRESVRKYLNNNGTRSWGLPERRWLLEAWRDA